MNPLATSPALNVRKLPSLLALKTHLLPKVLHWGGTSANSHTWFSLVDCIFAFMASSHFFTFRICHCILVGDGLVSIHHHEAFVWEIITSFSWKIRLYLWMSCVSTSCRLSITSSSTTYCSIIVPTWVASGCHSWSSSGSMRLPLTSSIRNLLSKISIFREIKILFSLGM